MPVSGAVPTAPSSLPAAGPIPGPKARPPVIELDLLRFEKETHVHSYLEQLPAAWVTGEGTWLSPGMHGLGVRPPAVSAGATLPRHPRPLPPTPSSTCPGTTGPEPAHHRPHAFAIRQFQKQLQTVRRHECGFPRRTMGSPQGVQGRRAQRRACTGAEIQGEAGRRHCRGLSARSHTQLAWPHPAFR